MTTLVIACAVLVLLAAVIILWPTRRDTDDEGQAQANLRWYALREAELARDGDDALREDAQLRLLEDHGAESAAEIDPESLNRFPRWVLLPVLGAASVAVYLMLGAAPDVLLTQRLQTLEQDASAETVQQLMTEIQARSEQRPDNLHYLALLGRYHMGREDYTSAQGVYERLLAEVPEDSQALAFAAQAEYLASDRQLTDRARLRAEQSLAADPYQRTALSLLGMASFEQGEFRGAIAYWQRLLATEPPNSQGAQMIAQVIATAQQNLGEATEPPAVGAGITVRVELPEGAQLSGSEVVFVLARDAQSGSRMPIAVQRFSAAQLPLTVRLDDSRSMAGQKLSEAASVIVAVQVSPEGRPGEAGASWLGQAGPMAPGPSEEPVLITLAPNSPPQ